MTTATPSYIGIGLYTFPEVARLFGQNPRKLRRWASDYTERRAIFGLARPDLVQEGAVSFLDMIQLYMVASFRSAGLKMSAVRTIARRVAERTNSNHPFAIHRFFTDGATIIAELRNESEDERIYEDMLRGQMVMGETAQQFLRNVEYADELARMYWPLGREAGIVLDPKRNFGQPIIASSGVPTYPIYRTHMAGDSAEKIAYAYHVDVSAVHAAIEFEQRLIA